MSKALTLCGRLAYACDMALGITLDPKGNRCKSPPALDELDDFAEKVRAFEEEFANTAGLDEVPAHLKLSVKCLLDAAYDFNCAASSGRFSDVVFEAKSLRVAVEIFNRATIEKTNYV